MLIIWEPICSSTEHVYFNAAFLQAVRIAFPDERIFFYSETSHLQHVSEQLPNATASSIVWSEVKPVDRTTPLFCQFLHQSQQLRALIKCLDSNGPNKPRLLLLSALPSTFWSLRCLRKPIFWAVDVQVVLHTGYQDIHASCLPWRRIGSLRTALKQLKGIRFQLLVLEKSVQRELGRKLPSIAQKVALLEHPLPLSNRKLESVPFIEPIRFGYLGLCTERRGFPLFLKLAQKATALFSQRVEFHSIGRLASDLVYLDMSCLKTAPYLEDLPREDYLNRLLKLHFVVFPFPVRHTAMVSSGTLADTVAFRKPVIARNMPIFQDLCKQWGDIGYLFDEDAQMLQVVEAIIKEADAESYLRQTKNLERLSQSRSPEATASCYYATCQQLSSIT